ncbi:growth arrest-specific protein 1-like [Pectinophora gossypiella]|nr:growth arrest-specific protein 1-like [Pectinophora gossypiella]XP_049877229.1 growth arrest-specific protein 1-like [Pectinophora gossypiella]
MWVLAAIVAAVAAAAATPCEKARIRCAYRTGCGAALNNYMLLCNDVLAEPTTNCPKACEHALIALTSTEEGKELMNCQCEDEYCVEAKERIEVCRPQVLQGAANATASCRLSQLICLADAQCATALRYYDELCRSMYRRGRKCSNKCLNSIDILRKQEKAAALAACRCDGNEDFDCPRMQRNLQRLCFHKKTHPGKDRKHHKEKEKKIAVQETASAANIVSVSALIVTTCILRSLMLNS